MRIVLRALGSESVLGSPATAYAAGRILRGIGQGHREQASPAARMRSVAEGRRRFRHLLEAALTPEFAPLGRSGLACRLVDALNEGDVGRLMDLYADNVRIENPSVWPFTSTCVSAVEGIDDLLDHMSATFQRDQHLRLTLLDAAVSCGGIRMSYKTNRSSGVVTEQLSLDESGRIARVSCTQGRRSLQ